MVVTIAVLMTLWMVFPGFSLADDESKGSGELAPSDLAEGSLEVTESSASSETDLVPESIEASSKNAEKGKDKKPDESEPDETLETEPLLATTSSTSTGGGSEGGVYSVPTAVDQVYTGAAVYNIPIEVPPGRKGIQPNLALTYNSYTSNGWIGVGWSLEIGSIERSTKRGMDYSANDYVSSGDGELVERTDWGTNYFGAKVEEAFSKYYYNSSTSGWEVTAKDGTKYYYGTTSNSRQTNTLGTSRWCLDKVQDTNGNYMTISYIQQDGQIYPVQIDYTGNAGLITNKSVVFTLEDREDEVISYKTKSEVATAKHLQKISTYADGQLAKEYALSYDYNSINGQSRLIQIQEKGAGGETTIQPITLAYNTGGGISGNIFLTEESIDPIDLDGVQHSGMVFGDINGDGLDDLIHLTNDYYHTYAMVYLAREYSNVDFWYRGMFILDGMSSVQLGDVDGDGCADIVELVGNGITVRKSLGNGSFENPILTGIYTYPANAFDLADINGDGMVDLITKDTSYGCARTYLANGSGTVFSSMVQRICGNGGQIYIVDINGDGMADLVTKLSPTSSDPYRIQTRLSNGDGSFSSQYTTTSIGYAAYYQFFGDINGDGMTDLVVNTGDLSDPNLRFRNEPYLSAGDGSFIPSTGFQQSYCSLKGMGDVNGDGFADLFSVSSTGGYHVNLSKGNGQFYSAVSTGGSVAGTVDVRLADVNGDGMVEPSTFSYASTIPPYVGRITVNVAQTSDGPANYLKTVTNELGGTSAITYTKSSEYPDNYTPYILHPVSQIVRNNRGVISTTQYIYEGATYDYESREFWGFEKVKKTSPDSSKVETSYLQTPYLKGRVDLVETKDPSGTLLKKTMYGWSTYPTSPTTYGFVKLSQIRTEYENDPNLYSQEAYTYDDTNGNLLSTVITGTNAEAITKTNSFVNKGDWVWRPSQETVSGSTSGLVRQTTNTYESNTGNLLSTESYNDGGTNPVVYMTYDSFGNIATVTDAEGNTASTTYDVSYTFPETITLPTTGGVSHVTSQTWDSRFGKALTSTDQNGFDTDYTYDGYGRLIQVDYPDGGQMRYIYYDGLTPPRFYKLTKITTDSYLSSLVYYDGFGRVWRTTSNGENGSIIEAGVRYDAMGRNYRTDGPSFSGQGLYSYTEVVSYDYLSRPLTVRSPIDSSTYANVSYSYSGFSTTVTDAEGGVKTQTTDHLGRIIQVEEQNGGNTYTTTYEYNAAGDLIEITDDVGNINSFTYDTLGRKTAMNDPDMGYWQYTYDGNGNLLTQTDAKNQVITFTYDELNRVTSKTYSPSNPMVYYFYDSGTNGIGLPYQIANANATTTYNSYDSMGRSTSVTKTVTGDSARTTQTTYDLSGKILRTTYPDGYYVTNAYIPGTNLVGSVTGSDGEVYASISDYTPTGKMGTLIHGNGTTTTYTYNPYTTHVTDIVTTNGTTLQSKHYTYTNSGDIDSVTDSVAGVTYDYTYDDLHRLTNETNTGGFGAMQVTYNAIGNITQKTVGPNTFYMDYDSSHKHAVDYVTYNSTNYDYTYDANGNMTQGYDFSNLANIQVRTITYNVDNMPTSIYHGSGTTSALLYDGSGARAKKTVSGGSSSTTYYIGNHFEVKDGTAVKYVFAGNLRVAQIEGSALSYFHKDHLGSSTVMTDDTGSLIESTNYEPFGGQRAHTGINSSIYKFTDQEFDAESGLYNYDARMYDPIIGRFISPDSLIPDVYNPQALNRYSYCLNNPLRYTDPSGHSWVGDFFRWVGNGIRNIGKNLFGLLAGPIVKAASFVSSLFKSDISNSSVAISAAASNGTSSVNNNSNSKSESNRVEVCNEAKENGLNRDRQGKEIGGTVVQKEGELYACDFQTENPQNTCDEIIHEATMDHENKHKSYDVLPPTNTTEVSRTFFNGNPYEIEALRNRQTVDYLMNNITRCDSNSCRATIYKYTEDLNRVIRYNESRIEYED